MSKRTLLILIIFLVFLFSISSPNETVESLSSGTHLDDSDSYSLIEASNAPVKALGSSFSESSNNPVPSEWVIERYTRTGVVYRKGGLHKLVTGIGMRNAWNGTSWVPYIFEDCGDHYFVATGWFAAEIYPSEGYAVFYDANRTEVRIEAEWWRVDVLENSTWHEVLNTLGGAKGSEVFLNETHAYITLCFEVEGVGHLNVTYVVEGGRPIKHTVVFVSRIPGVNTFRIVQVADGILASSIRVGDNIVEVNNTLVLNLTCLEFYLNESLKVTEYPRDPAYNYSIIYPTSNNTLSAEIVYFDLENYTVASGESIELDPTTATVYVTGYWKSSVYWKGKLVSGTITDLQTRDLSDDGAMKWDSEYDYDLDVYRVYIPYKFEGSLPADAVIFSIDFYSTVRSSGSVSYRIDAYNLDTGSFDTILGPTSVGSSYVDKNALDLGGEYYDVSSNIMKIWMDVRQSYSYYFYVDYMVIEVTYGFKPTVGSASITNMDDTDNMYARYKEYYWEVVANDPDGRDDLGRVYFRLTQGTNVYCEVMYDHNTETFSETYGSGLIELDTSGSAAYNLNDTAIRVDFHVYIEWTFPTSSDLEIVCGAVDDEALSSGFLTLQTDYVDVVTDLTVRNFDVNDNRTNVGGSVTFTGDVYYDEPDSTKQPPATEIDYVSIIRYDTGSTVGSKSGVNSFSISITLPSSVGKYRYYPKVVVEDGPTFSLSSITKDVIADKLTVTLSTADTRVDIGTIVTVSWSITRQYDGTTVTDYSITITRDGAAWYSGTEGSKTDSLSAVGSHEYTCSAVTDNTYDITAFDANTLTVIWDRLEVYGYGVNDTHVNVSDPVLVWVKLRYDYDDDIFDSSDGSVSIEGIDASWNATGQYWYITLSYETTTILDCDIPSAFTDTRYGLTVITGTTVQQIIWDRLMFVDFSYSPSKSYVSVGTTINFTGYVYYEATNEPIGAQTNAVRVIVNGTTYYYSTDANGFFNFTYTSGVETTLTFYIDAMNSPDGVTTEAVGIQVTITWSQLKAVGLTKEWLGEDWTTGFMLKLKFIVAYANYTVLSGATVYLYTNASGTFQLMAQGTTDSNGYVELQTFVIDKIDYMHILINVTSPVAVDDNIYEDVVYVPGELLYFDPYPSWDVPDPTVPNQIRIIAGTNRRDCQFYVYINDVLKGSYGESAIRSGVLLTFTSPGTYYLDVKAEDNIGTIWATDIVIRVTAVRGAIIISIHDQQGRSPIEAIKVLVNGTEAYGELLEPGHRVKIERYGANFVYTHLAYNITIVHWKFGDVLWQSTVSFTTGQTEILVDAAVNMYSWKFQNQGETPVWVSVTRGAGEWSEWCYPWEIIEFWLFPGSYTLQINYTQYSGNYFIIMNGTATTTSFSITSDYAMILSGTTLRDVFGSVSDLYAYVENVNATLTNQIISVNVTIANVNSSLANQIINVDINLSNVNTTLGQQLVNILADISNVNATLFAQTVNIIANIQNLAANTLGNLLELDGLDDYLYTYRPEFAGNMTLEAEFMPLNATGTHYIAGVGEEIYALEFDGTDDYITISDSGSLRMQNLTIEMYIDRGGVGYQFDWAIRKQYLGYWAGSWSITFEKEYRRSIFRVYTDTGEHCIDRPGVWREGIHHYVFTWNGATGKMEIWRDGTLYASVQRTPGTILYDDSPLQICPYKAGHTPKYYFLRIYNRTLSQPEIQWNYQHLRNPISSGLVLWFDAENVRNDIIYDLSGNGNHGILYGGLTPTRTYFRDVWALVVDDGRVGFKMLNETGWTYAWANDTSITLRNGLWYRYSITWDGATISLYRDGALVASTSFQHLYSPVYPTNLTLGMRPDAEYHFKGRLRLFRFYNASLSAADVLWNTLHPDEPLRDNMLIWYPPDTLTSSAWQNRIDELYRRAIAIFREGAFNETNVPEEEDGEPWSENFGDISDWTYGSAKAMSFNDSNVVVPHSASLDLGAEGQSYTIEFAIKTSRVAARDDHFLIKDATPYPFSFVLRDGYVQFRLWDGTNVPTVKTDVVVADSKWHQIVGVRNADLDRMEIYRDGGNVRTKEDTTVGSLQNTANIYIGKRIGNFEGEIAYVRIYNRALNATEIQWNYEHPDNPVRDGLVLWLHYTSIDETAGVWEDISGYENDGTIYGATTVDMYWDEMRGMYFNGTGEYVEVPDSNSLDIVENITLEAFLYIPETAGEVNSWIPQKGDAYQIRIGWNEWAKPLFHINGSWQATDNQYHVSPGRIHHLVATYSAVDRTIRFYIDNDLKEEKTLTGLADYHIDTSDNPVVIPGGATLGRKHIVYHVRIYNRTLTADEIRWNYYHPDNPIHKEDLVLWLSPISINEAAGVWEDLSGYDNDGINYGGQVVYGLGVSYSISSTGDELDIDMTVSANTAITLSANSSEKAIYIYQELNVNVTVYPFLEVKWWATANESAQFTLACYLSNGTHEAYAVIAWHRGNFSALDRANLYAIAYKLGKGYYNVTRLLIIVNDHPRNASQTMTLRVDWLRIYGFTNYTSVASVAGIVEFSDFSGLEFWGNATVASPTGTGLSFDGEDDYVEVSDFTLSPGNELTFEVLMKVERWRDYSGIIAKYKNAENRVVLAIGDDRKIRFGWSIGGTGWEAVLSSVLEASKYYDVVATAKIRDMKLYVNGVLDNSKTHPYSDLDWNVFTQNIWIARYIDPYPYLDGVIAYVRIYNRALSEEEIQWNYQHPYNPVRNGLVLWLMFDEGKGNVVHDLSGNGNHGTIYGGAEWIASTTSIEKNVTIPSGTNYLTLRGYGDANVTLFVKARFSNGSYGYLLADPLAGGEWSEATAVFTHAGITKLEIGAYFCNDTAEHWAKIDYVEIGRYAYVDWDATLVGGTVALATSNIMYQTVTLMSNIYNLNTTLYSQTVSILSNLSNVNSTLYQQTLEILSDVQNTNATIYAQTLQILADIQNVNSTLYQQTLEFMINVHNWFAGYAGTYLSFDGEDDYVQVADDETIRSVYPITIEVMFKIKSVPPGSRFIVSKRHYNVGGWQIWYNQYSSVSFAMFYNGGVSVSSSLFTYDTDVWYFLDVVVVNETTVHVYLNGDYRETLSMWTPPNETNENLMLASNDNGVQNGHVDIALFRFYNWSLSASDVQWNYKHPYNPITENLTLWLDSDSIDVENNVWKDKSDYDNDGTIYGATPISQNLFYQTINVLANIENVNTTIYAQTIQILSDISNTNATLYQQTIEILNDISNVNSTLYSQTVEILTDLWNVNSTLYSQTVQILTDVSNVNSTLYSQTVQILASIENTNTTLYSQTIQILANIENVNSTLYSQTLQILAEVENTNSTLYSQTVQILLDIQNTNSTLYSQTVQILANIENVNSTLYQQTLQILSNVQNTNATLYSQTVQILSNIQNVNTTLYEQTVDILANIENVNSTLYQQTLNILADIQNVNTTLYQQTLNILADVQNTNATIYQQTVEILSSVLNTNATLYQQTVTILANIENVNTTLYQQTLQILANIENTNTTLYQQTVTILSNIQNTNATLYQQTLTILSNIQNTNVTLYQQTVQILSDISNVNSTLFAQTVQILSDISNVNVTLYSQTVTILSEIENTNATLYQQTIAILSDVRNTNATLYQQTIQILNDIWNVNVTLYSQTVTILNRISNVNATLYQQTVEILSAVYNTNSTIFQQTVEILNAVVNTNSTLYSQTVEILQTVYNVNSTLYQQTVQILTNIGNVNSTLYNKTLEVLTEVANANATLYYKTVEILTDLSEVNQTLYAKTVEVLDDLLSTNATLHQKMTKTLEDLYNVNQTLYARTVEILDDLLSTNETLHQKMLETLSRLENVNATLYAEMLDLMDTMYHVNATLYAEMVELFGNLTLSNATLYNQTAQILNNLRLTNNTLYNKTVTVLNAVYALKEVHFYVVTRGDKIVPEEFFALVVNDTRLRVFIYYTRSTSLPVIVYDLWNRKVHETEVSVTEANVTVYLRLNFTRLVIYNPNDVRVSVAIWPANYSSKSWDVGPNDQLELYLPYGNYTLEAAYAGRTLMSKTVKLDKAAKEIQLPYVETPSEPKEAVKTGNLLLPIGIVMATGGVSWVFSLIKKKRHEYRVAMARELERRKKIAMRLIEARHSRRPEEEILDEYMRNLEFELKNRKGG